MKKEIRPEAAIWAITSVALFSTLTNVLPFSAILIIALPLAFGLRANRFPPFLLPLYVFAALCVGHTLLLDPSAFTDFSFYRRDGNFFVSYAPLMLLPLIQISGCPTKLLWQWLILSSFVYFFLLIYYLLMIFPTDTFGGLFAARNAAGGFLAEAAIAAYVAFRLQKTWLRLFMVITLLACLVFTYSRGSQFGFFAAVGLIECHLRFHKFSLRRWPGRLVFIALMTGSLAISIYNLDVYRAEPVAGSVDEIEIEPGIQTKEANIIIRLLYVWPRAMDDFLSSPILGIGFGSFDDLPTILEGLPFLEFNQQPIKKHTDAHAHNSFLHILAETGLVGFVLICAFLWRVQIYLDFEIATNNGLINTALLAMFYALIVSAFSEHRLFTPSQALPFTLLLSAKLATRKRAAPPVLTES